MNDIIVFKCHLCNIATNHLECCDGKWVCISCMNTKNLYPSIGSYVKINELNEKNCE